jgi:hypothetical protein
MARASEQVSTRKPTGELSTPHQAPMPEEILGTEASAASCDRLIADVGKLASADDAALWSHRCLAEKKKVTASHALLAEEAFDARLADLRVAARTRAAASAPAAPLRRYFQPTDVRLY